MAGIIKPERGAGGQSARLESPPTHRELVKVPAWPPGPKPVSFTHLQPSRPLHLDYTSNAELHPLPFGERGWKVFAFTEVVRFETVRPLATTF